MAKKPRSRLTLITPPSGALVTLEEMKQFARVDYDHDDDLLDSFIVAATTAAENYTRRSFLTQTWRLTVDLTCGGYGDELGEGVYDLPVTALYGGLPQSIELPRGQVRSITGVTTYDLNNAATVFDASNYRLDSAGTKLLLNYGKQWPSNLRPIDACIIEYTAGYGDDAADVPRPIREAVKMHAAHMYESRGMCDDTVPAGCQMLLRQYQFMVGL